MTPKERVLSVYADAKCVRASYCYHVRCAYLKFPLGSGDTEQQAWEFAADRITNRTADTTMNDPTQQLRERIERLALTPGAFPDMVDAIMQDVQVWHEVQAVKRERQAYARGWNDKHASATYGEATPDDVRVTVRYPLPTRTREVLREEPVPGTGYAWPAYRVRHGVLETKLTPYYAWRSVDHDISCASFDLMRHAVDLHDNPTRTEEVPIDESNPWGDE